MKKNIIIALSAICFFSDIAAHAEIVHVVVNEQVVAVMLTKNDLRDIYLGKKTLWDNGTRIKPIRLPNNNPATQLFFDEYVGKSLDAYLGYWRRRLFTGEGVPPAIVSDEQELIKEISSTAGAIGYSANKIESAHLKDVKVLD